MEFRYLYEFSVVAQQLNFSDAAGELFMSQATLSKHIAAMEEELGCKLFERSTHQVSLTDSGKILLASSQKIIAEYGKCLADLDRSKAIRQKTIRIASIPVIETYGISDLIIQYQKEHPNIEIQIRETEEKDIPQHLKNGDYDLAFQRLTKTNLDEFHTISYCHDELVVLLPKNHKLHNCKMIPLEQLKEEPFLLMDENTALYDLCVSACKKAGFEPKITYCGHRPENIVGLAAKGMGVSLLPRKEVDFFMNADIQCIPLAQPIPTAIYLTNLKQSSLEYPCQMFVDYVKKHPM